MVTGQQITDDLDLLLDVMPPRLRQMLAAMPEKTSLVEVVLDLGRLPEARFPNRGETLANDAVTREDIAFVVARVGRFGKDNRAGIERTLHRISAIRNRVGDVIGLTCRVGRAVFGTVDILRDVIETGKSMLLLGRPGVGKTTLLREAARVLADELGKRVVVVDTSNEIAGDGDIPHPGIGRARRMQVPSPDEQHAVMIEAVENHMPQVIVIDEIGTAAEALAARTIAERGVQLVATAHGNTLDNLLQNPTLSDLVGGIQPVTLSDEEARRRGTQKTVLERKAPPTFDVLIEIQDKDRLAVHRNVAEVVDRFLRDVPPRPELRERTAEGGVEIRQAERAELKLPETPWGERERDRRQAGRRGPVRVATLGSPRGSAPRAARATRDILTRNPWELGPLGPPAQISDPAMSAMSAGSAVSAAGPAPADLARAVTPEALPRPARGRTVRIYPYAVNRDKLDRAIRKFRVPAVIVDDLDESDLVLSLKAQERRQPRRLRDAAAHNIPLQVIKSNTIAQMENFLRAYFDLGDVDVQTQDAEALQEVEDAIDEVLDQGHPVELAPRNNYLRRLQHQVVERYGLTSTSKGEEPYRRVVVFPG